jgi:hypothetical protein
MFLRVYAREGKRMPTSFEGFVDTIGNWPGMFCEMDGSFVWSILVDEARTQIDGMIYDRDGSIEVVELKGNLTAGTFRQLMLALAGEPAEPSDWDREFRIHDVEGQLWKRPSQLLTQGEEGSVADGH